MVHVIRQSNGQPATALQTASAVFAARQSFWVAGCFALGAFALLAAGCGGGDKKPKQSTTVAQNDSPDEGEKDAAPAPPPKKKQKAAAVKAEEPEIPAASTKDVTKWDGNELKAALLRKDVMFVTGVAFFGAMRPNDVKRAEELDTLTKKVAALKDDPAPEIPIPAGAFAEADPDPLDTPAKPGTTAGATSPAAAGGKGARTGGPFRGGGRVGGGK
jgi:hypothetical protein